MPKQAVLRRKSFFVDPDELRRARRVLRVRTDAEAVRLALERVTEMDRYWRFMTKSRASVKAGSFEAP
jgi:hypothetical protein